MHGDHQTRIKCDTTGGINPGANGANVIWDFSMISYLTAYTDLYSSNINYQNCFGSFIPSPNLMVSNIPISNWNAFYYGDSIAYYHLGSCQDLGFGVYHEHHYNDPLKIMKFPWVYGDTLSDQAEGPSHQGLSNSHYNKISLYQECDGWGKLILPNVTYDSVLRVHVFRFHQDSILNVGIFSYDSSEYFTWYTKNLGAPAFEMGSVVLKDSNGVVLSTGSFMNAYTVNHFPQGVNDKSKIPDEAFISPNPFGNKINVSQTNNSPSEIIIYDITSRKLINQQFTNTITINTEQLPNGIYVYQLTSGNGLCKNGKLVKE